MPKAKQVYDAAAEKALMTDLWTPAYADDPLAFVLYAFPWGKKGTPLEHQKGPRKWQIRILQALTDHIAKQRDTMARKLDPTMFMQAVASGRGIGKSALVAWLIMWVMSTRLGVTVVVTANTEAQLTSRTWAELGKWHAMAINSHWFDKSAMSLRPAEWFAALLIDQLKIDTGYYYAQAQLWSEEKPDAFAGVHNHNGIMVIFDEASGIPQPIWTVTKGFFTEPVLDRYWFAFSNPRNNTGAFFECFHKFKRSWRREQIDSRTVEGTDKAVFQDIINEHGENSDEANVEVKGQFPNAGARQFIPMDFIVEARERPVEPDPGAALILAADVARYGEDASVIRFRKGLDARTLPARRFQGLSTMQFADEIVRAIDDTKPDAVVVDENGVGGGVVDRLRQLGYHVIGVNSQGKPKDEKKYLNLRAELYDLMKDWLRIGCIDDSQDLLDDLKAPEYDFNNTKGVLQVESKEKMKARGLASPNDSDALMMTFAVKPARRDISVSRHGRRRAVAKGVEFNLLG